MVTLTHTDIQKVAFACDAGMGSSAMGASTLRSKFMKYGIKAKVIHCAVEDIPKDVQLVVTHNSLVDRAKKYAPEADIVGIFNFIGAREYDGLVKLLRKI